MSGATKGSAGRAAECSFRILTPGCSTLTQPPRYMPATRPGPEASLDGDRVSGTSIVCGTGTGGSERSSLGMPWGNRNQRLRQDNRQKSFFHNEVRRILSQFRGWVGINRAGGDLTFSKKGEPGDGIGGQISLASGD